MNAPRAIERRENAPDHVILIDDDEALRIRVSMLLRKAGFRATSAGNGDEGLGQLLGAERTPALILLDLAMPVMDGWHFREIQRAHSKLWHIPVVVLADAPVNADYLEEFGAAGVLVKPFDCGDLMRAVSLATAPRVTADQNCRPNPPCTVKLLIAPETLKFGR